MAKTELVTIDVKAQIREINLSQDVVSLSEIANHAEEKGSQLQALAYIAAHRIYRLYGLVDATRPQVLIRHLRMTKKIVVDREMGATAIRRFYCETMFGWTSFNAWVEDWATTGPSRGSIWMKVYDIDNWLAEGCSWRVIFDLLTNVPMAAREAIEKPVAHEAMPISQETGEPSKELYLAELAALPPGQARKKVSADAGEQQIFALDSEYQVTRHFPAHLGRTLMVTVRVETTSGNEDYNLVVYPVDYSGSGWGAVALWISDKLGKRISIT